MKLAKKQVQIIHDVCTFTINIITIKESDIAQFYSIVLYTFDYHFIFYFFDIKFIILTILFYFILVLFIIYIKKALGRENYKNLIGFYPCNFIQFLYQKV